jgi:hypothetical protein
MKVERRGGIEKNEEKNIRMITMSTGPQLYEEGLF